MSKRSRTKVSERSYSTAFFLSRCHSSAGLLYKLCSPKRKLLTLTISSSTPWSPTTACWPSASYSHPIWWWTSLIKLSSRSTRPLKSLSSGSFSSSHSSMEYRWLSIFLSCITGKTASLSYRRSFKWSCPFSQTLLQSVPSCCCITKVSGERGGSKSIADVHSSCLQTRQKVHRQDSQESIVVLARTTWFSLGRKTSRSSTREEKVEVNLNPFLRNINATCVTIQQFPQALRNVNATWVTIQFPQAQDLISSGWRQNL